MIIKRNNIGCLRNFTIKFRKPHFRDTEIKEVFKKEILN